MIKLVSLIFLLILNVAVSFANGDETFSARLGQVDIPDKFKLTEITIGRKNADIHLIIYSSFTCPHCREFHRNEFPKFKKEYIDTGKVKVSFRCYLDDQGALESAQIARCLGNESTDKYMFLYHEIYKHQVDWLQSKDPAKFLKNIFVNLGFDRQKVEKCLKRTDIAAGLMLEQKRAMHELGLLSMPTFLVNGKTHVGKISYEELLNLCGL